MKNILVIILFYVITNIIKRRYFAISQKMFIKSMNTCCNLRIIGFPIGSVIKYVKRTHINLDIQMAVHRKFYVVS